MTSGNQLEFLQFTSYVRYFLVILIETCSKGFSFGKYSNSDRKSFKIDPKVGSAFCYINSHGAPQQILKNSTEIVKEQKNFS